MNFSSETVSVVTNGHKRLIGLVGKNWRPAGLYSLLFFFTGEEFKSITVDTSYINRIDSYSDLDIIETNINNDILEIKESIKKHEDFILKSINNIKRLKRIKVIESTHTSDYYKSRLMDDEDLSEDDIFWPDSDSIEIKRSGRVFVPDKREPWFYNSMDDLLQFEKKDIVEIKFKDNKSIPVKYRGKKISFVVNSCKKYETYIATKMIALTPLTEKWLKRDVLLLDSYENFEAMMEDLFECNRSPFRGWKNKTVTIKKTGVVDHLPMPKVRKYLTAKDFEYPGKNVVVFTGSNWGNNNYTITGLSKGYSYQCRRVYTTADVKMGVDQFLKDIEDEKKKITQENNAIIEKNEMLKCIQFIRDKKII